MAKKRLLCNAGVIDAGYRGEIIVLMENLGDQPYEIKRGDKIAQLLEHPFVAVEVVESELSEAVRGAKGFGSTGKWLLPPRVARCLICAEDFEMRMARVAVFSCSVVR